MGQIRTRTIDDLLSPPERGELEASTEAVYGLWPDLTIAYVNPAWRAFVERHDGALAVARRWALGRSVLDAVDEDLRPFYDRILRAALGKSRRWHHQFECSGRSKNCRYRIDIRPLDNDRGLLVGHTMLVVDTVSHTTRKSRFKECRIIFGPWHPMDIRASRGLWLMRHFSPEFSRAVCDTVITGRASPAATRRSAPGNRPRSGRGGRSHSRGQCG